MGTPPTLIGYWHANAAANTQTSTSITAQAGDIVTVICGSEGATAGNSFSAPTTTWTNSGITQLQLHAAASDPAGAAWTFAVTANGAGTVTGTQSVGVTGNFSMSVYVERNAVKPTVARSTLSTGAGRTVSYTASQADSSIHVGEFDWAAAAVQTPTPPASSHSNVAPGPTASPNSLAVGTNYTYYQQTYDDQSSTGAVSYGIGGAGAGPFTIIVVEVQGSGGAVAGTQMPRVVNPRNAPIRVGRLKPPPQGVQITTGPTAPVFPGQPPTPVPRRPVWRRRGSATGPVPEQSVPLQRVRRILRPTLRPVRRPAEPVPPVAVPTPPAYVPPSPRRMFKGVGLRSRRKAEVTPPQVIPPIAYVPQPQRRVLRGWTTVRRHTSVPEIGGVPPVTRRLRSRMVPLRRVRTEVPAQQVLPLPPVPRTRTKVGVRRRRPAEPVPPQVTVAQPYVPESRRRGLKGWPLRRRSPAEVVPPQVAAAQPPKYVTVPPRRGFKGWQPRRRTRAEVVPPQVAVAPPPKLVPTFGRRGFKGWPQRRRTTVLPPQPQSTPPTPQRRAFKGLPLRRPARVPVTPPQPRPAPQAAPRRGFKGFPTRRRTRVQVIPPQVAPVAPRLVPFAPRRGFKGWLSRRGRAAQVPVVNPLITLPIDPRVVITSNPGRVVLGHNAQDGLIKPNLNRAEVNVDALTAGDLLPAWSCTLFNGAVPYDATGATSVTVKMWQNGVLVVNRAATSVAPNGVVTMNWVPGDTAEPGPTYVKVVVVQPGAKPVTFPPKGHMTTFIHPVAP